MKSQFVFFLLLLFLIGSTLAWGSKRGKRREERNKLNEVNEKLTESLEVEQRDNFGNVKDVSREAAAEEGGKKKKKKKARNGRPVEIPQNSSG